MRDNIRPTLLPALDIAAELTPPPAPELAGLPFHIRVQCRLFDTLVLLAAVRKDLTTEDGRQLVWAAEEIEGLCRDLDRLLERFAS